MGSTTSEHLKSIILGLGMYFFPLNTQSKQKCVMHQGMRNLCNLNIRRYADCMIDLNKYLAVFIGSRASDKICEMQLNEFFFEKNA